MHTFALSHVADGVIERGLTSFDTQNKSSLAVVLAHLAEFDARRLYLPAAFPSLRDYCTRQLHWCEQAALKRIRAARVAHRFPGIFPAVADGRLHLSAVLLLGPHLRSENADELLAAAAHKSKVEIELLLAERFPREDVPTRLASMPDWTPPVGPHAAEVSPGTVVVPRLDLSSGTVASRDAAPGSSGEPMARVTPLSPGRFSLHVTLDQETRDLLQRAQELLSHGSGPRDVPVVLKRALGELVERLERRKHGTAARPGARRANASARHIPAHVRKAVWERDGGSCTFVSESGRRCESREQIQYDHALPVARGGEATVEGVRLLCRAHNQFEAECTFGAGFMAEKREEARRRAEAKRAKRARGQERVQHDSEPSTVATSRAATDQGPDSSVIPWLRSLGVSADQAKRAAEAIAHLADAPLEQRVKAAFAAHAQARFPNSRRTAGGLAAATSG